MRPSSWSGGPTTLRRQAEAEHGRWHRPPPPDRVVEGGIGTGRHHSQIHAVGCYMAGKQRRRVDLAVVRPCGRGPPGVVSGW